MILFNYESKLVMSNKKKEEKPIIVGHLKSLMIVILKKKILKDIRMKQTKTKSKTMIVAECLSENMLMR